MSYTVPMLASPQSAASVHATGIPLRFEARNCVLVPRMSCSVFFPVCVTLTIRFSRRPPRRALLATPRPPPATGMPHPATPLSPASGFIPALSLYGKRAGKRGASRRSSPDVNSHPSRDRGIPRFTAPPSTCENKTTVVSHRRKSALLGSPIGAGETLPK